MKDRFYPWWLGLVVLALVAAAPASNDPDVLVGAGDIAFARGDYETALDCYSRAEERTTQPEQVCLKKAKTLYRLERYRDAELHFNYCKESVTGPERAELLYDLG